jgi:hypothetical protein
MTREITTIAVFLSARMGAAGQTPITSTVPPGTSCTTTLNGCTLHNLTTTAPTITPWGWFAGGTYYISRFTRARLQRRVPLTVMAMGFILRFKDRIWERITSNGSSTA